MPNKKKRVNRTKNLKHVKVNNNKKEKYTPRHGKIKRLKIIPFIILMTIFASLIVFSSYEIYSWYQDNQDIKNLNKDIKKKTKIRKNNDDGELVDPVDDKENDYWYYVGLPFYEVDFNELLKKNKDTVAFIHMENTNINYPVVQAKNNDYYLHHAFDKSRNDAGWVFLDYRNNINNLDDNNVIYGHGRLDKTVFGSLKDSLTKKWQTNKDNYAIWLSTPKENMVFQIFSIYTIQEESYYITTHFNSESSKQKWLDTMKGRNTAPIDTPVSLNSNILTLSTCQNNEGGRIVVQAKLVKRQAR